MRKLVLVMSILCFTFQVFSQQNYSVSWGVSNYDTLTNATYILPWDWHSGKEIDFEFDFPYFSGHYNSVIFNIDGIGGIPWFKCI